MSENKNKYLYSDEIIRIADSYEIGPSFLTISVSCSFPNTILTTETAYNNLKNKFDTILSTFPQFRLNFKKIDNFNYWHFADEKDITFEKLIFLVQEPDNLPPKNFDMYEKLWKLNICKLSNNRTKLRLFCNHSFCDGRNIFEIFEILITYALDKKLPDKYLNIIKNKKFTKDNILCSSFGKKSWFNQEIPNEMPKSWKLLKNIKIFPKVDLPSYQLNKQWNFDYEPIKKFLIKNNVSIQGIISTIGIRSLFEYNKENKLLDEMCVCVPNDTRYLKNYTSDEHKNNIFLCHNNYVLNFFKKIDDINILDDIIRCTKEVRKIINTIESVQELIYSANFFDEEKKTLNNCNFFPDCSKHNMICASNIGKVLEDYDDLEFGLNNPVDENGYWSSLYAFHNNKKMSIMWLYPFNIDQKFFETMEKTINDVINFINNS